MISLRMEAVTETFGPLAVKAGIITLDEIGVPKLVGYRYFVNDEEVSPEKFLMVRNLRYLSK